MLKQICFWFCGLQTSPILDGQLSVFSTHCLGLLFCGMLICVVALELELRHELILNLCALSLVFCLLYA